MRPSRLNSGLKAIQASSQDNSPNRPRCYMERLKTSFPGEYSASKSLLNKAKTLAQHADMIVLPGGEDLPPKWYDGDAFHPELMDRNDNRALFEFCLLDQAYHKGIPLTDFCRGLHTANVFFGGKLVQDLPGKSIVRTIIHKTPNQATLTRGIFPTNFTSFANHHQGLIDPFVNKGELTITLQYDNGIVEGVEPKANLPWFLYQFHPEFRGAKVTRNFFEHCFDIFLDLYLSENNSHFFYKMAQTAHAYRAKKNIQEQLRAQRV